MKEYQNGDTTVVWKPDLCYHSKNCVNSLPSVFDPVRKPWIAAENATEKELRNAIEKCPSGALSYRVKGAQENRNNMAVIIEPLKNGPVVIKGKLSLKLANGKQDLEQETIALCRCGASSKKPFCDGSHLNIDFKAD